jgi:hypothetical protein
LRSPADAAASPPLFIDDVIGMTFGTAGLGGLSYLRTQPEKWTARRVDVMRDRFEMLRIDASANTTEMIELETLRNLTDQQAIAGGVGLYCSTVEAESTVARLAVRRGGPQPARSLQHERTIEVDLLQ